MATLEKAVSIQAIYCKECSSVPLNILVTPDLEFS